MHPVIALLPISVIALLLPCESLDKARLHRSPIRLGGRASDTGWTKVSQPANAHAASGLLTMRVWHWRARRAAQVLANAQFPRTQANIRRARNLLLLHPGARPARLSGRGDHNVCALPPTKILAQTARLFPVCVSASSGCLYRCERQDALRGRLITDWSRFESWRPTGFRLFRDHCLVIVANSALQK